MFFSINLVVNQKYKVQVHDEYVMSGNTAVLKCQVSLYPKLRYKLQFSENTEIHLNNGLTQKLFSTLFVNGEK